MANAWIIAIDPQVAALVGHRRAVGGSAMAVTAGGTPTTGVDEIIDVALPENASVEAATPAVAATVAAEVGDVVLIINKSAERVLAGVVATKLNAAFLLGLKLIKTSMAEFPHYGGLSFKNVIFDSPVVVVLDGGAEVESEPMSAEATEGSVYDVKAIGQERTEVAAVNLEAARRVILAGRGFRAKEDFKLAEELAVAIGAELACSYLLAGGADWMTVNRYIGVSGQIVSPELYIVVGISGQIQRTVGMNNSKVVVAVSSGPKAPMFAGANYRIVNDLYEVLPALMEVAR